MRSIFLRKIGLSSDLANSDSVSKWVVHENPQVAKKPWRKKEYYLNCEGRPLWLQETMPTGLCADGCVIFLHGNTFPAVCDFDLSSPSGSLIEQLASDGQRSFIFDHRGFGRSYKPKKEFLGAHERSVDLEVVIEHVKRVVAPKHITFVALSSAVITLAEYLRRRRSEEDSIVLLGPTYIANSYTLGIIRKLQFARLLHRALGRPDDCYLSLSKRSLIKRLVDSEESELSREMVERFLELAIETTESGRGVLRAPAIGFIEPRRLYRRGERLFDAKLFTQPMLILRGERDSFCTGEDAKQLIGELASDDVSEHVVPKVKHDFGLYPKQKEGAYLALQSFVSRQWGIGDAGIC